MEGVFPETEYQLKLCINAEEAIAIYEPNKYDVILVDIEMPGMNGLDFTREIRKRDDRIPIIFITASSEQEMVIKAFESGGNDYIVKPFNKKELIVRTQNMIRIYQYQMYSFQLQLLSQLQNL